MTRSKVLAYAVAAVLGASVNAGLIAPAHAEAIDLVCVPSWGNIWPYREYLSIDLTSSTATEWISRHSRAEAPTTSATITDTRVTFRTEGTRNASPHNFSLDRRTGELIVIPEFTADEHPLQRRFSCRKAAEAAAPLF